MGLGVHHIDCKRNRTDRSSSFGPRLRSRNENSNADKVCHPSHRPDGFQRGRQAHNGTSEWEVYRWDWEDHSGPCT